MANLILTNNSSQVEQVISQHHCRLTGSYSGPLNASSQPNSGFLIQNGNKQSGLFVGNTCTTFYNNCLNFDPANTDVNLNIPDSRAFIITGNGSLMTFGANGTLAVGTSIDANYKGIQVVNSNPIFLLKDSDSINQSGTQALSFFDSNSILSTSLCNEPASIINTGLSITDNATNIVYNKYFRLRNNPTNGGGCTLIASNNNLTLFSGNCLNRSFNLAVGGTSYFSSDLSSSGIVSAAGLCVFSNNFYLKGSGDNVALNICNNKNNSSGTINFYNASGGLHSLILSSQNSTLGCSEIDFYTTNAGGYNITDRKQIALEIKGDKSAKFYGNICAESGYFNCQIISYGIENSGCRTYLAPDFQSFHFFGSNANNCAYGISISSNSSILNHVWLTSSRKSMCLDSNQNLIVTGCLFSSGINSNSALIVNNLNNTDSCIRSRCIVFCANGANQNIINCGNFVNYGNNACFSGICSTGNQLNCMNGCLCLQTNLYTNCLCLTAGGGVCGPLGCFTTCSQSQVVCSNSCIRGDSVCSTGTTFLNCFSNSVCVNGFIEAQNATKAWGHFELIDGAASNCAGYNFNSLIIRTNTSLSPGTINFIYGLKLTNAVKYPFSLQMSVMPKGTLAWNPTLLIGSAQVPFSTYGVGAGSNNATCMPNYIIPICSGVTAGNIAQAYVANSYYCDLFFTVLNCKYFASTFAEMCKNLHDANIMFTINSL